MMKNRTIPFEEFYACLQREWIVAELRYRIYDKPNDKKYYKNREMDGKRKAINDIASRNNYPTIFDTPALMNKYKEEIYNEWGLPNFIYRSAEDRIARRMYDILAYFHRDVAVKVKMDDGSVQAGIIVWCNIDDNSVDVRVEGEMYRVSFDKLRREFD